MEGAVPLFSAAAGGAGACTAVRFFAGGCQERQADAHRDGFALLHRNLPQDARAERFHLNRHLIGFDLGDGLTFRNGDRRRT